MVTRISAKNNPFVSYAEAKEIVWQLNICSAKEYGKRYKESKSPLPANPQTTYHKHWKANSGWTGFLGFRKHHEYLSYDEAKVEIIKMKL